MSYPRTRVRLLLPLGVALAAACSESPAGPRPGPAPALSHTITVDELGQAIAAGPARVEVKLASGTLVAREVELKTSDELTDEESIRGAVTAAAATGGVGTLTFDIGGLVVGITSATRFRAADGANLDIDGFVAHVEAALAAGAQPFARAKRAAPATPQGPGDASFDATEVELRDVLESPKIEINVDADNFERNAAPPPEAWLRILGLEIQIVAGSQVREDDSHEDEGEVEGIVESVNLTDRSVTLRGGATILIPDGTPFEQEGDDDEHLASLAAVDQALQAGRTVKAEAEGAVQGTNPLTIVAREVEFEVEDAGNAGGNQGETVEYQGFVQSAGAGQFVLASGTIVKLTDQTVPDPLGDLMTLQAVADALTAGKVVRAEGRAVVESSGPPPVLVAATVKWEVDN